MSTKTLVDKIEALPPEKKAEVEEFVELLASRSLVATRPPSGATKTFPDELLERIARRRERLFREHGYFDTLPILRDLKETGPR